MHNKSIPSWILALLVLMLMALPAAAVEVGSTAPDFELKTLDERKVKLSDYKGQPILLKLATTWCPTCKEQQEEIEKVEEVLAEKDVAVVEVFLQDSEKMVREYLEGQSHQMPYVALLDDGSALKAYNVYLIPRVLLISPDFKVLRDGSLMEAEELARKIEDIAH